MTDFLTKRNGVVCHDCFNTIDLTEIKWKSNPTKIKKILTKIYGPSDLLSVTCPHCKNKSTYSIKGDVKPIADYISKEEHENSLKNVKEGAKLIANELLKKDMSPEIDEDSADPVDPKTLQKLKNKHGFFQ